MITTDIIPPEAAITIYRNIPLVPHPVHKHDTMLTETEWCDLVAEFWREGWQLRQNDFKHTNGGRVIGFEEAISYWLDPDKPTASPPPF